MPASRVGNVLVLLHLVSSEWAGRTWTRSRLLELLGDSYPAEMDTAERYLSRDLQLLRSRGLITTGTDGVRRNSVADKHRDYWLAADEHAALDRLWHSYASDLPMPDSLALKTSDRRVERALAVLRLLEEQQGRSLTVEEMARRMRRRGREIDVVVQDLLDVDGLSGSWPALQVQKHSDGSVTAPEVQITRRGAEGPLHRLGLFAYDAVEVCHRLALLERGLLDRPEDRILQSARQKLLHWQRQLPAHAQAGATPRTDGG